MNITLSVSASPRPLSLFSLPNELLFLILEHLSLSDLYRFYNFVELSSPNDIPASSLHPTDPRSVLLELFRHRGGFLFHRCVWYPSALQWLQEISVLVSKLILKNYNDQSHQYLMEHKEFVEELDFHLSPKLLNKHLKELDRCPALTSLSLANCAKINDSTLQQFLKLNPQLERLNISATPKIGSGILPAPHSYGQNIRYLDVSGSMTIVYVF
jgi:hypothetical protein